MENFPDLYPGSIQLLLAPHPLHRKLATNLAVQLALRGPLRILDGGNRFDLQGLARELRRQTRQYHTTLTGIEVARAFTCYQMTTLLAVTEAQPIPTLVIDLLTTFQDESVALVERQRLLGVSVDHLGRLSRQAILLVSTDLQIPVLLSTLLAVAGHIWQFELPETCRQHRLL